ncbi:hypothetical protein FACS1894176_11260 [Bacteroidia bacterium]|nr:hypothetical protein FACS1894176_11260 [Bacteroidia bacterium]
MIASLHQSLNRTGLDYFDIFYSHRYDANTPVEETIQTLIDIVKQGKALYIGLSKYPPEQAEIAYKMMQEQHTPCLIFQDKYNLLHRDPETQDFPLVEKYGAGFISFSPLAQGLLTNRYLNGIPTDSRAAKSPTLDKTLLNEALIKKLNQLNELAQKRGQTLAEMSLAWLLYHPAVTSVIVGASSVAQLKDNMNTINNYDFSQEELMQIDSLL